MSTLAPFALMLTNLADMTDEQFRDFVDGLGRELAPANFLEQFLVGRITLFINRMRRSARVEAEGQPPDARWQRYEAAAERGFWNAYKELMNGRRKPKDKAAPPEPIATTAAVAAPPPPQPAVKAPAPAARPAISPRRPEPSRLDFPPVAPVENAAFLNQTILPPTATSPRPTPQSVPR